jgi:hypothetical protein
MRRTEAFVEGGHRRRRILTFRERFANFNEGNVWNGIFTPINGKLKFLGEYGRCFIPWTSRLRNDSFSGSSRGLSSSVGNLSLPFRCSI